MKTCSYCEKSPVYYRKISNEYLCKNHFTEKLEKRVITTIKKFSMIGENDRVAVAVSGGKDSLVLLRILLNFRSFYPKSLPVEAILIDEGISGYREESLQIAEECCKKWDTSLHIVTFKEFFGNNLDDIILKLTDQSINACTICGTVRRRLLNDKAKEIGADVLAIGHNLDDQAETFLQNIIRNDLKQIELHAPTGNPKDPDLTYIRRIKPLYNIPENEIVLYCYYNDIPIQSATCPYSESFFVLRKSIQVFLNTLEQNSPEVKYNLIKMNFKLLHIVENQRNGKLPDGSEKRQFCKACGEFKGMSREICLYCEMKEKFRGTPK